ncbi:MAG: two-component system chemotaxis family CheB/CheR fusion protein, partial [Planctomycetota bacterium]
AKQERLQAILNINFSAVLTCDRQGLVESVNLAGVRMFGYSIDEMIGQDFRKFVPPPDGQTQDAANRSYLEMGKDRMSGYSVEVVACRKDGSTFPADLAVSEIPDLGLFCSILRDLSDHKRLEREVSEATAFEQRRIGQDLHDSVGQRLTALTMLAQDFVESFGSDAQVSDARPHHLASPASPSLSSLSRAELAERLRRDLQQTLEEVRSISRNLNPVPVDSQGLTAALADLVERMRLQSRVKCSFDCESPVVIEDNVTATHLFHIAQEALSNALRHAHAREVRISLWQDDLQIVLQIQDDGDGVSWPQPRPEGIGLRIMKGRADMIGATLTFDRADPKGTQVNCILKSESKHRN